MNAELEASLIECLDALERGEPVAHILARYPASAAQLRPLLTTAMTLPAFRMEPSEQQKMASRQAFLDQAATLRQAQQPRRASRLMPRFAMFFAALSVMLAVLGSGAVVASGSALPGDPLYPLKRTVENARLAFTADAAARTALRAEFETQRRLEASALLEARREIEVEFSGPIESIQANAWVVAGLVVRIDGATQISGTPQLDRWVTVRGRTQRTGLRALAITIQPGDDPTSVPTVLPTITPLPMITITATPNPIVLPEPTEPRPTRAPPPTPTPAPTARPTAIEFTGSVDSIGAATWVIDGATVSVNAATVIAGNISVGQRVKVQALRDANDRLVAQRIELINDGGGGSSGGEQNGNSNDNGSTNENGNSNEDGNSNENGNDNGNENQNSNDNQNHNGEDNQNGNDNSK